MGEVFKKYKENFSNFIIFFVLSVIVSLVGVKFNINGILDQEMMRDISFKDILNIKDILLILIQSYVITYGLILAKKVIKEESIDQKSIFSKTFYYYPRMLGLFALFIIMIFLITILFALIFWSSLPVFVLGVIILLVFILMLLPVSNYLVYYDTGIWDSIKSGFKIGKKHFFKILGLFVISVLVSALIDTKPAKNSILILAIYTFIGSMFSMYFDLYINNLFKIEEENRAS